MKEQIEHLLTLLEELKSTGKVKVVGEDAALLKKVYQDIFRANPNVGCPSCVTHALYMLESYYLRTYVIEATPEPEATPIADNNIQEPMKNEANQSTTENPKRSRKRTKQ
jgi:hypothetical protein